jgi:serine/threonine protein kinase
MIKIPIDEAIWQSLSCDERIDAICDAFEVAWQEGKSPSVADYAALMDSSNRAPLLRELMLVSREFQEAEKRSLRSMKRQQSATVSLQSGQIDTDLTFMSVQEELPQSLDRELPTNFGDYILLDVLGRGSFGIVYRAQSTRTDGIVALKIPHPALVADPDNYKVFVRESTNVAALSHRGIVKVYNVEYEDRIPFLVSEYVVGKNLKDLLATTGKFPPRLAARFILELAETVEHSHQHNVIHRDIKPSNILVENSEGMTSLDESVSELRPRLLDFGIAKLRGSNTLVTQPGVVLGTPAYMSPEQARGDSSLVTPQSDIYSLGTLLYELLSGKPPFQGEPSKVIQQVQSEEAPPLLRSEPLIPKDLSVICEQALRLVPTDRYASAASLADDLQRFLNDEPIRGRSVSLSERLAKKIRKHSAAWSVATIATVIVIVGLMLAWRSNTKFRNLAINLLASDPNGHDGVTAASRLESWLVRAPQSFNDSGPLLDGIVKAGPDRLLRIGSALKSHGSKVLPLLKNAFDANEGLLSLQLRIACLIGVVDPVSFENLGVAKQLTDWLVDSACFDDTVGWMNLTYGVRKSMIPPLVRRYQLDRTEEQHVVAYKLLTNSLEKEPVEQVVGAIMASRPQELASWKRFMERDADRSLVALAAQRKTMGVKFEFDKQGEASAAAYANLLLVEYGLGNSEVIWPHLKIADDPRFRSYLVHQLALTGFDEKPLIDRLSDASDPSIQYAVLLAISQFTREQIGEHSLAKIQAWLPGAYQSHPDCGVHSMCRLLMKQWGLDEKLQAIDQELRNEGLVDGRNWYVNPLGMQMLIVRGPINTVIHDYVSTLKSTERYGHTKTQAKPFLIPRSFAIGTDVVTVGQYLQFQNEVQRDQDFQVSLEQSANATSPVNQVSWIEATKYCQWLSLRTGISESQAATYTEIDRFAVEADYRKSGYRLPTRAEWEYSCRAATVTDCSYGTTETPGRELYVDDTSDTSDTNRLPLPNAYGLFACYGSVSNWTSQSFSFNTLTSTSDPDAERVSLRSGVYVFGYGENARKSTSSGGRLIMPREAKTNIGFRVAHTLMNSPPVTP